ncbi:hypothetical protein TRAPUB_9367 [Trametes pubescens]|uniref:Protein kinase domain-containing protein n=1 Tax=Trametes pubescens TaxID=154538 RepID=A0A1M2W2L3_TRAPU|nr:hypothetical protein TRAPUB_9367 [Trametes pubescens]
MQKHAVGIAVAAACLTVVVHAYVERRNALRDSGDSCRNRLIRQKLPRDLEAWRLLEVGEGGDADLWGVLHDFFGERGFTFWTSIRNSYMGLSSDVDVASSGFGYAPLTRGVGPKSPHEKLYRFSYPHPSCQAAQTADGRMVIIRVLAIGESGREHVDILKDLARGPFSLVTYNHAIPLLELLHFEDITFGVFPKIGGDLRDTYGFWAENSVGDILDMLLQCLEMLGYIHNRHIAHRDAFKDNFLVQWHPETMRARTAPISRPRVYLNDFETAVRFPLDMPAEDCVCVGLPVGPSFSDRYCRPVPPEVQTGKPYDPFKLDVWQFSTSFADFKCHIPEVDGVLERMRDPDPTLRPPAWVAMNRISDFLQATPPQALYYPPEVVRDWLDDPVPADAPVTPIPEDAPFAPIPADAPPAL